MRIDQDRRRGLAGIARGGAPDATATPGKQTLIGTASGPAPGGPPAGQRPASAEAVAVAPRTATGTMPAPIAAQGAASAGPLSFADPLRACFGRRPAPDGGEPGPA